MKRLLLTSSLLLIFAIPLQAQTTNKIEWDYLATTLTVVQSYNQQVFVDNILNTSAPVCVTVAANVTCSLTIPALSPGNHSVRIDATLAGITKSTGISGINPGNAPKDPTNFRYSITVNINVT